MWYGSHPEFFAPMYGSSCYLESEKMRLGESTSNYYGSPYRGYTNFTFWDTCCSANLSQIGDLWDQTFQGLHQLGGFNGLSIEPNEGGTCTHTFRFDPSDFAGQVNVANLPVGTAWLNEMKYSTLNCPVILGFAATLNAAYNSVNDESWSFNWGNPVNYYYAYRYWTSCNGAGTCDVY